MREIVLDTETTGLSVKNGHRLIEIGCIELVDRLPSGKEFHSYLNPERRVDAGAFAVHGLSDRFLRSKPLFPEIVDALLAFLGTAPLIIHNAPFDLGFLNAEIRALQMPPLRSDRVVDTLALARLRNISGPANLDALCRRYNIDNSKRIKHGALMDALLLSRVYVELLGERQASMSFMRRKSILTTEPRPPAKVRPNHLRSRLTKINLQRHTEFIDEEIGAHAIWHNMTWEAR